MIKIDSVVFYSIEKAIKTYRDFAQNELKRANCNITIDEWLTLNHLLQHPECTQKDLCEAIFKDKIAISKTLNTLSKKGWIDKNNQPSKKQHYTFSITPSGIETIHKTTPIIENNRKQALKGIGIPKEKHVKMVMDQIIMNCTTN